MPAANATRAYANMRAIFRSEAKKLESDLVTPWPKTLRMTISAHNYCQFYNDDEGFSSNDTPLPFISFRLRNYTTFEQLFERETFQI